MPTDNQLDLIKRAIDFIESNLTNSISVDDVCGAITNSSPWQFQRLFRLYTADSIGSYLRSRRLTSAAMSLLQNPDQRILDVAVEFQFGSHEAFTRSFKKMFDVTPADVQSYKGKILLKQKMKLSGNQLSHNLKGIQRDPVFMEFPNRAYAGLEIQIPSPFTDDFGYVDLVTNMWLNFNPRRKEILQRKTGKGYALVRSPSGMMIEDTLSYVASVEIELDSTETLPLDMKRFEMNQQLYACFETQGVADTTRMSLDYIYGLWLPQSDYKRATGFDMKIFDFRMRLDRPDSVSTYCIPVQKMISPSSQ
jgi:AraC family transcriptional regulator